MEKDDVNSAPAERGLPDPFMMRWSSRPSTGWVAKTAPDLFCVLSGVGECLARLAERPSTNDVAAAQQMLARVWRPNNPLLVDLLRLETEGTLAKIVDAVSLGRYAFDERCIGWTETGLGIDRATIPRPIGVDRRVWFEHAAKVAAELNRARSCEGHSDAS